MSDHRVRVAAAVACFAAVVCLIAVAAVSITLLSTRGDVSDTTGDVQTVRATATAAKRKTTAVERKANRNTRRLTQVVRRVERTRVIVRQTRTVLRQQGILGPMGRQGIRGPGPTDGQVSAAVERYCNVRVCGRPPTVDQVLAGLRECSAGGGCRGEPGRDGTAGRDAPAPTGGQIAIAVEGYCARHGGCTGPTGAQGPAGPPAGPFTFSFQGSDGVLHVCTVDTALGVEVVQPCAS